MGWTDQTPQIATEEDVHAAWDGGEDGKYFRCYLCGRKFTVGDAWRWVWSRFGNITVCAECDGPDVIDRWHAMQKEAQERFWWFFKREE